MTTVQQGWIYCADGFSWLQRLTAAGLLDPTSLRVDVSEVSEPGGLADSWKQYRNADGWYIAVPVALVNALAAEHGGIVDGMSSHVGLSPAPDDLS